MAEQRNKTNAEILTKKNINTIKKIYTISEIDIDITSCKAQCMEMIIHLRSALPIWACSLRLDRDDDTAAPPLWR